MMWACEQKPQSWWKEVSPVNGVLYLLQKLNKGIQKKLIRHYFIEGFNLLEHFPSFILVLTELKLLKLKNNLVQKLSNLLKNMIAGINIVYENLIKKQTHSLNISVAFIYKQKSVSKLGFAMESLVKLFWYHFFYETYAIYKEISQIKSEIIMTAQLIDLLVKFLQLKENEEMRLLYSVQNERLANLMLHIIAFDKTVATYFDGLLAINLLSCVICDVCGVKIKCNSKRYSCSKCAPAGGFDICLNCIKKATSLNVEISDTETESEYGCYQQQNKSLEKYKIEKTFKENPVKYLFQEKFSSLEKIAICVPKLDIEKFDQIYSYEQRLALGIRELNHSYCNREFMQSFSQGVAN
ncbi:uncharacterized protein LOC124810514 isoform X4 [Hydra vulgaris]|uniref:Uncharacterized protein LOC124810514 isoform X4 n=1 Tax=Hydra vulgaris TaxID=6087 RepID=A0ABM4B3R4_HYDVU